MVNRNKVLRGTITDRLLTTARRRSFPSGSAQVSQAQENRTFSASSTDRVSISNGLTDHTRIIDVSDLASEMRASVRNYTQALPATAPVKLLGILAQNGPYQEHAELYSDHIAESSYEDGIDYELLRTDGSEPAKVEAAIEQANQRRDVHGILVYYPIFKGAANRGPYKNRLTGVYYKTHDDYLRDLVCGSKDVEGLSNQNNARWLWRRDERWSPTEDMVFPCTAVSVCHIIEKYHISPGIPWEGTAVTIVNRSEIFGRPLAALLAQKGATVYSVDEESILLFRPGGRMRRCSDKTNMEWCLQNSQIVVSGVPSPEFSVPCEWIQNGATVIDVSEYDNICEDSILAVPDAKFIPHVGKVTIAVLEKNLIQLHRKAIAR